MKTGVMLSCLGIGVLGLTACGGAASSALDSYKPATVNTPEDAKRWAKNASAPNVYLSSTAVLGITGLNGQGQAEDTTCPKRNQDGNTLWLEGDCTDSEGRKWVGKARRESEAAGSDTGRFVYEGFGYEGTDTCGGKEIAGKWIFEGVVDVTGTEEEIHFDIDVRTDFTGPDEDADCAVSDESMAWDYTGTVVEDGSSKNTWSGSGRVGSSKIGVATVETKDEVIDMSVCDSEAISGTTTLTGGSDTVVITYDGATDCESSSTVQWSLNGEAKGELTGVSCASAGSAPAWALLAWPAVMLLWRRRSRDVRGGRGRRRI
ncbi:MAG: hypothetical protein IRZ16_05110 [Myxococcaceae bacterium]|nr:hypothetical protein [Myxococcaceae bacterium]